MKKLEIYRDDSDTNNPGLAWRVTDDDHVESGPCDGTDLSTSSIVFETIALAAAEGITLTRSDIIVVNDVASVEC